MFEKILELKNKFFSKRIVVEEDDDEVVMKLSKEAYETLQELLFNLDDYLKEGNPELKAWDASKATTIRLGGITATFPMHWTTTTTPFIVGAATSSPYTTIVETGTTFTLGEPEYVGAIPIRQEIDVIPAETETEKERYKK